MQEATEQEIDQIAADFHAQLSKHNAKGIGAIYARYSSRFQHSIADQVRTLYEAAVKHGIFVPRSHVFFDLAVRGYKDQRPGLNQLRALLAGKGVDVFLVFTTNRLFRKNYKSLQFVEEEVVERGIRCLFVKSGIDTADEEQWRLRLQLYSSLDELVVGMYAENIRAAHEGLFDRRIVCGTLCFGYKGEPIPGEFTKQKRPRCRVIINPETRSWVVIIFEWFVKDNLSISEIVRRLNASDDIPLGPKSITGQWTNLAVRSILSNPRYRGWWEYGATKSVWQSKKDYSRKVRRAEPLRAAYFEELRIVTDELWHAAQQRLAEIDRSQVGRKPKDGDRSSRPRLLNGLFRCPTHDRQLYVGGGNGKYMFCSQCKGTTAAKQALYSQLPRELALRLTCQKLAELVKNDDDLAAQAIAFCQQQATQMQQPDPAQLEALKKREKHLTQQIHFLLENAGETEADRREAAESLRLLRRQRAEILAETSRLEAADSRQLDIPTEKDVRSLLEELGGILIAAAQGDLETEVGAAREIITLLTGGCIDLYQQGERKAQRGWLQGRFRVRLLPYLAKKIIGADRLTSDDEGVEVTIDYRESEISETIAEQVKSLWDAGLTYREIAAQVGWNRNIVTRAVACWHRERGLEPPDGRFCRQRLAKPSETEKLADPAKALWDQGLLMEEIAERLNCCKDTVTGAIQHWFRSRGLEAPDGRVRRKTLARKCRRTD